LVDCPDGLPLGELARCVKWAADEPVHAIFALVVEGCLTTSIESRIEPEMRICRAGVASAGTPGHKLPQMLARSASPGQLSLALHDRSVWEALDSAASVNALDDATMAGGAGQTKRIGWTT
jgi:hypothetical protein